MKEILRLEKQKESLLQFPFKGAISQAKDTDRWKTEKDISLKY